MTNNAANAAEGVVMIVLGSKVQDCVTGFAGIATARAEYLHDSPSVRVEAFCGDGGKPVEQWISESRLDAMLDAAGEKDA